MPRRHRTANMNKEEMKMEWHGHKCGPMCWCGHKGGMGGAYCLGVIGAAIYYLQNSTGFGASIVALLKALVWPAFLVYHLLGL